MVANGEATVDQIDTSITEGPGLRWAFHGPMLTFHLAGGPGGMAHMLDHFGPSLLSPWTRLVAPDLTPELRDSVVRGCAEEAGRADHRRPGARARPQARRHPARARQGARVPEPLVWAEDVRPEWIDYNGHLSEAYYVLVFGHATDAAMGALGHDAAVPGRHRNVALHAGGARPLSRRGPAGGAAGGALVGDRRDRQAAVALARDVVRRTGCGPREEVLAVHVDTTVGRSSPFPDEPAPPPPRQLRVPPPDHASRRIALS